MQEKAGQRLGLAGLIDNVLSRGYTMKLAAATSHNGYIAIAEAPYKERHAGISQDNIIGAVENLIDSLNRRS